MPLTPYIVIVYVLVIAALAAGATWYLRGRRCQREKAAVNFGWQQQIDAQRSENARIVARNTRLMTQLSEAQAAADQQKRRLENLAKKVRKAERRRDELQQEIQQVRGHLEEVMTQRNLPALAPPPASDIPAATLAAKNQKIARLKRELGRWQQRVPPLVERYRERDAEANELAALHAAAVARLAAIENEEHADTGETRLEPLEEESIKHLAASNDQYDDTLAIEGKTLAPAPAHSVAADDLKRIKGIGPSIEKKLHRLGIVSFQQLASLSPVEIDRVAGELRGFHSRIAREDWAGQASQLLKDRGRA